MTHHAKCPCCGSELTPLAPAGICAKCLLAAGLESVPPGAQPTTPPAPRNRGFDPPSPSELAGRFPHLEILSFVGKGGMGAVYKARQPQLDRLVALKILPPEAFAETGFAERFTREAKALARLNHPNIVGIYDFGRAGDLYYFVMEFVEGANLREALRAGRLSPPEALAIVPQICDALQYAHDEGVVHRDIKPENILLDRRGRVKIADFGLAKLLGQEHLDASITATHQVLGTLRYMAPEQMESSHAVDHRCDIYSLGVVFYELLTGEVPAGRFPPPSKKVQVDVRLDEVVLRALERQPEHRYQHASEVKSQIASICSQPAVPAKPLSAAGPYYEPSRREDSAAGAPSAEVGPMVTPWGVYVVALGNVLGALLLMFVLAGDTGTWIPASASKFWWSLEQTSAILSYCISAATLIASLGLFLWQPWARTLTIGACWASLATLVIDVPYVGGYYVPQAYEELVRDFTTDESLREFAEVPEFAAAFSIFVLLGGTFAISLGWLIGQAIYLQRPAVSAALERGKMLTPAARKLVSRMEWLPVVVWFWLAVALFTVFATAVPRTYPDEAPLPPIERGNIKLSESPRLYSSRRAA